MHCHSHPFAHHQPCPEDGAPAETRCPWPLSSRCRICPTVSLTATSDYWVTKGPPPCCTHRICAWTWDEWSCWEHGGGCRAVLRGLATRRAHGNFVFARQSINLHKVLSPFLCVHESTVTGGMGLLPPYPLHPQPSALHAQSSARPAVPYGKPTLAVTPSCEPHTAVSTPQPRAPHPRWCPGDQDRRMGGATWGWSNAMGVVTRWAWLRRGRSYVMRRKRGRGGAHA